MTNEDAIKWLDNLKNDIGNPHYERLWPYAQAIDEICYLLKEQEAREPHYTILKYLVDGTEVAVHHPECPRCIENGLMLWDAEIEKGQAYCKRCGQAVKWDA